MRSPSMQDLFSRLNGSPIYLGTISASTSATSFTTGLAAGQELLLQADADCFVLPGGAASVAPDESVVPTVTAANGLKILADEKYFICMPEADSIPARLGTQVIALQAITSSGTANIKVFKLI